MSIHLFKYIHAHHYEQTLSKMFINSFAEQGTKYIFTYFIILIVVVRCFSGSAKHYSFPADSHRVFDPCRKRPLTWGAVYKSILYPTCVHALCVYLVYFPDCALCRWAAKSERVRGMQGDAKGLSVSDYLRALRQRIFLRPHTLPHLS